MKHERYCQSCAMPLEDEDQLGTNADGSKNGAYCRYCYQNGGFTQPDCTMQGMIDISVPFMVQGGMEETQARRLMEETLPHMKRWQKT